MSYTIECEFCYNPIIVSNVKYVYSHVKCEHCKLDNIVYNPSAKRLNPSAKRLNGYESIEDESIEDEGFY